MVYKCGAEKTYEWLALFSARPSNLGFNTFEIANWTLTMGMPQPEIRIQGNIVVLVIIRTEP
jgi:hypothetical protein